MVVGVVLPIHCSLVKKEGGREGEEGRMCVCKCVCMEILCLE